MTNICRYGSLIRFTSRTVTPTCRFSTCVVYRDIISGTSQVKPAYQSVVDFYAGKSVFLTGATGFIGRLLIERLLYTCKDIENVYILIRPNENGTVQQRLQLLLDNEIFNKLKMTRPQDLRKVVPIEGDIGNPRLGMNMEDEQTLIEKVSVVFHSAANIRFRAPLSELMRCNHEGTKQVMEMGKKIKKMDAFVYVSTAFSNTNNVVHEIPYPPPRDIDEVNEVLADNINEANKVKKLIDGQGNKYVFSKSMAEGYVSSNYGCMRTIIVRPSMVTSVYKEPLVGYTDSWVSVTGVLCDLASGLNRVIYGNKDDAVELIPADYVCNFLIAAAAKSDGKQLSVYNISTGDSNPITWRTIAKMYINEGKKHSYVVIPFPTAYFTKIGWVPPLLTYLAQILPFAGDTWLRLTGKPPRYTKLQKRAASRNLLAKAMTDVSWCFKTTQAQQLMSTLNSEDRGTFYCDPKSIEWGEYLPIYCKGVKDYNYVKK